MKRSRLLLLLAAASAVPAFASTHVGIGISFGAPAPIIVHHAPPARVYERVSISPGPGYVWIPGHYTWAGDRWIWMTGTWVVPPQPAAHWVDGAWNPQTRQWVEAHWELPPPPPPPVVYAPATPPPPPTVVTTAPAPTTEVVVAEAPPPPITEVVTVAPAPGYIWIGGYWGWEHGRREWIRGHWELPPHGHRVWVEPRWEHRGRDYVYIRGYWR